MSDKPESTAAKQPQIQIQILRGTNERLLQENGTKAIELFRLKMRVQELEHPPRPFGPIRDPSAYPGWPHRVYIGDLLPGHGTTIISQGCNNPDQGCDDLGRTTRPFSSDSRGC